MSMNTETESTDQCTNALIFRMHSMVSNLLLSIAGVALVSIVIIVATNILLRQFATSFGGTAEVVGWLTAVVISLSLAESKSKKVHVSMSALIDLLPNRLSLFIQLCIAVLSALFFLVLSWQLCKFGINIMDRQSLSPTLQIPYYGFIMIAAFGFFAFSITLIIDVYLVLNRLINRY